MAVQRLIGLRAALCVAVVALGWPAARAVEQDAPAIAAPRAVHPSVEEFAIPTTENRADSKDSADAGTARRCA